MADNIKVAPSATGKDIAADDISDVLHQRVKVQFGVDGSATDVSATNPLPVTIDAGDVVSVDDNGGSLTVDGTVAATQSGTWNVGTVATVTNPVAVTDNGGSLTVDGTVTAATGATNAAAAAGQIFPAAVRRVDTPADLANGALGYVRGTRRQAVMTAADFRTLTLTSADPVPTGSDIVNSSSAAIVAGDLQIRDTNAHIFVIPVTAAGWRHIRIGITNTATWDQVINIKVRERLTSTGASSVTTLGDWNNSTTDTIDHVISSSGSVGQGGVVGGATTASRSFYSIPALQGVAWIQLTLSALIAPTSGNLAIYIVRST